MIARHLLTSVVSPRNRRRRLLALARWQRLGFGSRTGDYRMRGAAPRRKAMIPWRLAVLTGVVVLAGSVGHAVGQEQFRLEDGEWRQQAAPDANTPEGQLQLIRRTLVEGRPE